MAADPVPKNKPEGHFKRDRMHNPPKPRPPWPRPGSRRTVQVGGADTWQTVATQNHVADVWDLISWNFGTPGNEQPTPRQVNWYMHHYIGCWRSHDSKNFSFLQADPGLVQIPPIGWTRGMWGQLFHMALAQAVRKLVHHYPRFALGPYKLSEHDLIPVGVALLDGRLMARVDTHLPVAGQYDGDEDEFVFKTDSTASFDARLIIAHEATHAMVDAKYVGLGMRRWQFEIMAYTAEALWALDADPAQAEAMLERPVKDVFKKALVLARYMRAGVAVGALHTDTLMQMHAYDTYLPSYKDSGIVVNPFNDLKKAVYGTVRRDSLRRRVPQDPDDVLTMNGWKRPGW